MRKKASRTNPRDAKRAVQRERTRQNPRENISPPPVRSAEKKQEFLSSPQETDLYFAANALLLQRISKANSLGNCTFI